MADPRKLWSSRFGGRFGPIRYRYALVPWTWNTSDPDSSFWELPSGAAGGIDLRPLSAMAAAGGVAVGFAFAALLQPAAGVEVTQAVDLREQDATIAMQDVWEGGMGYRPQGAKLVDLLWDQLTSGADPSGENGPKPLMPTVGGQLELHLGGHSLIRKERFLWGRHPHTNRVQSVLQRDFEALWEDSQKLSSELRQASTRVSDGLEPISSHANRIARHFRQSGKTDAQIMRALSDSAERIEQHPRRVLDFHCEKYRVDDWREFVPQRLRQHVPGRLPHATTITDDFNRSDNTDISTGGPLTWTEVLNDFEIASNVIRNASASNLRVLARAESDLSSSDHYAQVSVSGSVAATDRFGAAAARYASAANTCYLGAQFGPANGTGLLRPVKIVTGSLTNLGSGVGTTQIGTKQIRCNGSTISVYHDGGLVESITDTSITSGTRCGMGVQGTQGNWTLGNFEAADLAAPGGLDIPIAMYHRLRSMGV